MPQRSVIPASRSIGCVVKTTVNPPAADVAAAADELPVLGTLTVTEMEVSG